MIVRPAGLQQPLNARDNLIVDIVAGERISRTGPGIGQVDIDQRRFAAESDEALEAAFLIELGRDFEGLLQPLLEFSHFI